MQEVDKKIPVHLYEKIARQLLCFLKINLMVFYFLINVKTKLLNDCVKSCQKDSTKSKESKLLLNQ